MLEGHWCSFMFQSSYTGVYNCRFNHLSLSRWNMPSIISSISDANLHLRLELLCVAFKQEKLDNDVHIM